MNSSPPVRRGTSSRRVLPLRDFLLASSLRVRFLTGLLICLPGIVLTEDSATNAPPPATITLEALVAEVLRGNPELEFYRAEIAAAQAGRRTAAQWNNPELSGDLGSKRVWERGGGATLGDGVAWSVAVSQSFEWPGRIALRKAIADGQVVIARLGLDSMQAALAARTRALGHTLLVAHEKAQATDEVARRFQSLLEVLVQREPAGITPRLDQRILEATTLTLNRRASEAAEEMQKARIELNLLRGQRPDAPLALTGVVALPTEPPVLDALFAAAATNNFSLRQRQLELAQQGFQVQLARNERYPKVTLAPFYAAEKANDEQRIVGVGVSLPVPLWNQNRGNIDSAHARQIQAEAAWRVTQREVERDIATHALALQTRLDEMARWRSESAAEFREAAALADRHYRLGAVPVTTYVEMQTRYLDALEALYATRGEALEHQQQLELLTGLKPATATVR